MADDLVGYGLVVGRVCGVGQSSGIEQTEAEPLVDPVSSGVHAPAWVVAERRRL